MKKKRKLRLTRLLIISGLLICFGFFVVRGFSALVNSRRFSRVLEFIPDLYKAENRLALTEKNDAPLPVDVSVEEYEPLTLSYDNTVVLGEDVVSNNAILLCADDGTVVASRNSKTRMYPASMTKIMSLLVAVEHITNLEDTFTMTFEIINPLYLQNATVTGLSSGETVPLTDLLYGAILPSGADATDALAIYVAGGEEGFVELMNEKAEELGLIDTHFTNTSGLHDENHYTTAHDMAIILDCVMKNDICREILSSHKHVTTSTEQHPDGIEMYSTMFNKIRRDQIENVELLGGKTGYTYQAGHCLVSAAEKNGKTYIAVTGGGETKYSPIYDIMEMYGNYI